MGTLARNGINHTAALPKTAFSADDLKITFWFSGQVFLSYSFKFVFISGSVKILLEKFCCMKYLSTMPSSYNFFDAIS